MSQSGSLRHLKDKCVGRFKHIVKGESLESQSARRESTMPDTIASIRESPWTPLEAQAQPTIASDTNITTRDVTTGTATAENQEQLPAALQAVQPVRTPAGPVLAVVERMPSKSPWYSESTPKWNDAVNRWMAENSKGYLELERMTDGVTKLPIERVNALSRFQPASNSSKHITARVKRWQSTFTAIRGIGMSVAALDPHKIAPIICASVFFSIDILFNNMQPELRDKVLDILFDCGNTIRECISFEMNFAQKSHPAIESDISVVEDFLSGQYIRALRLIYDIQRSCKEIDREYDSSQEKWKDWVKIRGRDLWNAFTNQYAAWESDAKDIKRQKDSWTTKKRYLEDRLSADEHIVKVRKWIRKANDPEPQIDTIMRRVMPDEKYEDAAQWFLDLPQFDSWCDTFLSSECPPAAKRVLWLRGTYGTGKTTLLYHTYIALKDNPEFHIGSRKVRIVPYFCEAKGTTRPDYETIIRALIRHLSLLPDFSLAKVARDWYSKATSTRGQGDDPDVGEWEDFFEELVQGAVREYKFVFIVDALDECLDLREAELFLDFMSKRIMRSYPNVYMLCSSHQQVRVSDYFYEERRHDVEVTPTATAHEMEKFITGERERRKSTSGDSIFYHAQHTDLLDNLQNILLGHARGMFRWVQIWLDICLPALDDLNTIRKRDTATRLLDQLRQDVTHKHDAYQLLESGYQRLWDFNGLPEYQEERIRLFQIVLGVFEPLTPKNLKEALRIQGNTYNPDVTTKVVRRLYSNFLYEDTPAENLIYRSARNFSLRKNDNPRKYLESHKELRFVHESARKFILGMKQVSGSREDDEAQFSERNNHWTIAQLYIDVVGLSTHPFWQANGLKPSNWTEYTANSPEPDRLWQDRDRWKSQSKPFHSYLARNGLEHCALAAEKRSMFDALWSKVLDNVILSPVSALGFTILVEEGYIFRNRGGEVGLCVLRESEGHVNLLPSHALAILNIIHEDDVSRLRFTTANPGGTPEEDRQRRLFEHAACVGGNLRHFKGRLSATALHLACGHQNPAAVDMILRATEWLSKDSVNLILFTQCKTGRLTQKLRQSITHYRYKEYNYPIGTAFRDSGVPFKDMPSQLHIIETLLKFERCNASVSGVGSRSHLTTEPCISKQWSLPIATSVSYQPALPLATIRLEEDQLCHLLSVARPKDINIRDTMGYTVLHRAAREGLLRLAHELVEKYDADIEAKARMGETPSFLAFLNKKFEILEYFGSRGAHVDFEQGSKPALPASEMGEPSDKKQLISNVMVALSLRNL